MAYEDNKIAIKNTRFIFRTNLRGELDPDSKYPSTDRVANVVVPAERVAELEQLGINVRSTKPREGEEDGFQPTYFVKVKASYRDKYGELKPEKRQPKVILVRDEYNDPVRLDEDSVKMVDEIDIHHIDIVLNPWTNPNGGVTLYITHLYVVQEIDDDPFASQYIRRAPRIEDDEELPFE